MAKLMVSEGVIVIVAVISPMAKNREINRKIHEEGGQTFFEVYLDSDLETCEKRDVKGLYKLAR